MMSTEDIELLVTDSSDDETKVADIENHDDGQDNNDMKIEEIANDNAVEGNGNTNFYDWLWCAILDWNDNELVTNNDNDYVDNFRATLKNSYTVKCCCRCCSCCRCCCCCSNWCFANFILIGALILSILSVVPLFQAIGSDPECYRSSDCIVSHAVIGILINLLVVGIIINALGLYGIYRCKPTFILLCLIVKIIGMILFELPFVIYNILFLDPTPEFHFIMLSIDVWIVYVFVKIYRLSKFYEDSAQS